MSNRIKTISIIGALAFSSLASPLAVAGPASHDGAVYIPAVIGAAYNSPSRADSAADVRRQGGFATAGAVRWLATTPDTGSVAQPVFHVPGVIGAMTESSLLTRSAEEVRHAGGFATAGAVRWLAQAPQTKAVAAF